FSAQRDRIAISNMNGTVFGGKIAGDADVFHWSQAAEKTGAKTKATAGQPQRGSVTLKVHDISVAELAAAISTPRFPLDRVQPAGRADGTIDVKWIDSPRKAETSVALDIAPPANPKPHELPINARLRFAYGGASQMAEVSEISLATRATRFIAAGTLGSDTARLNVALNTTDLSEFQPALSALRHPGQLPVVLKGRGSFTGRLFG